jgi:hypothetical protein
LKRKAVGHNFLQRRNPKKIFLKIALQMLLGKITLDLALDNRLFLKTKAADLQMMMKDVI